MTLSPWLWRLTHSRKFWGISIGLLLASILLFYAITNTFGSWKLERVRQDLTMRGYALTLEDVIKTNPPVDEDLLRHEVMLQRPPDIDDALVKMGYRQDDLNLWSIQPKSGERFSAAAICGKPGADERIANTQLLRDLSIMELTTGEINAAIRSSKGIGWERTSNLPLLKDPTIGAVSWIGTFIPRRAVLRAAAGDSEGAMDDLRLSYEYLQLLNQQPRTMLGAVIGMGRAAVLVNHSWQLTQEPSITLYHLREMDQWLIKLDQDKSTVRCYRLEMMTINEFTELSFGRVTAGTLEDMDWSINLKDATALWSFTKEIWRRMRPLGLAKLELASILQQIDQNIIHLPDGSERGSWTPEDAYRFGALARIADRSQNPQAMIYIAGESMIRKYLNNQTISRMARVGIAIELHRREHGKFPDSIEAMIPNYLDKKPLDAQSGNPIMLETSSCGGLLVTAPGTNSKTRISWPIMMK